MSSGAFWNLCPQAFSWSVVITRYREQRLVIGEIVEIELRRLVAGFHLTESETYLANLLSDEYSKAGELLDRESSKPLPLAKADKDTLLWLRIVDVREAWDSLEDPQFYVEELLDLYDHDDRYGEARFFADRPRKERGLSRYMERLDSVIGLNRDRLCSQASSPYGGSE